MTEYYEIIKNDPKYKNKLEHLKKKIYKSKKLARCWDHVGILYKSTIYRNTKIIKKEKPIKFHDVFKPKDIIDEHIMHFFTKHKSRIGRRPIKIFIKKKFNIDISNRQIGRRMNRMALFYKVRIVKRYYKQKEKIHKFIDVVKRDFDNLSHKENIVTTDITYLNATNDIRHNHIYLLAAICHKTKRILSFELSDKNDINLVLNTVKKIKLKNIIILHSDHGMQYTSNEIQNFCKRKKWIQSMFRPGNALDNRVIEYLFSIFKSEFLRSINTKAFTLNQLKEKISNYIKYYNNNRIQEKLSWNSPNNFHKLTNKNSTTL